MSGFFAVEPKRDCPHVADHVSDMARELTHERVGELLAAPCAQCPEGDANATAENWVCLTCCTVLCSRYVNSHMQAHGEGSNHHVVLSYSDLSTWCYACSSYIVSPVSRDVRAAFYLQKFGTLPPNVTLPDNIQAGSIGTFAPADGGVGSVGGGVAAVERTEYPDPTPIVEVAEPDDGDDAEGGDDDPDNILANPTVNYGHANQSDITEFLDEPEVLIEKVREVAAILTASGCTVAYTGAGISASTGLPTYRGPNGVWTRKAAGLKPKVGASIETVSPSFTHKALTNMLAGGNLHYIVSTNVDNLHRAAGVEADQISELHGNVFREVCPNEQCGAEYLRDFSVGTDRPAAREHKHDTARACDACGTTLRDSIVHFGEDLPPEPTMRAITSSASADVSMVLGTSMRVNPAAQFPLEVLKKEGGKMVIVNLQKTPFDHAAAVRVFARTDDFFALLLEEMGLEAPE